MTCVGDHTLSEGRQFCPVCGKALAPQRDPAQSAPRAPSAETDADDGKTVQASRSGAGITSEWWQRVQWLGPALVVAAMPLTWVTVSVAFGSESLSGLNSQADLWGVDGTDAPYGLVPLLLALGALAAHLAPRRWPVRTKGFALANLVLSGLGFVATALVYSEVDGAFNDMMSRLSDPTPSLGEALARESGGDFTMGPGWWLALGGSFAAVVGNIAFRRESNGAHGRGLIEAPLLVAAPPPTSAGLVEASRETSLSSRPENRVAPPDPTTPPDDYDGDQHRPQISRPALILAAAIVVAVAAIAVALSRDEQITASSDLTPTSTTNSTVTTSRPNEAGSAGDGSGDSGTLTLPAEFPAFPLPGPGRVINPPKEVDCDVGCSRAVYVAVITEDGLTPEDLLAELAAITTEGAWKQEPSSTLSEPLVVGSHTWVATCQGDPCYDDYVLTLTVYEPARAYMSSPYSDSVRDNPYPVVSVDYQVFFPPGD